MMNHRSLVLCCGLLAFLCLPGAGMAADRVKAVATTTLVGDLVRQVGGDRVDVDCLMGPGVDPHLYKASAGDVSRLGRASVVFYSGLLLEGRMEEIFKRLQARGSRVFAVAEAVPAGQRLRSEKYQGHPDPHVWGDPSLWALAVGVVERGLSEVDPGGAAEYRAAAERFRATLTDLHSWARQRFEAIPTGQRVLVTSHDAFGYFGRAFGLEVVGVQGISTVGEAGLADITQVIDLVRRRGVKAVFVESSVSPATIERISQDSGARIGGELFSDALGTPGEIRQGGGESYDVGTYVGMLKHNINTVVEALR